MQHDIVLKKLKFDLLTPRVRGDGQRGWSAGKIIATILLHFIYLSIHYLKRIAHLATLASLPCGPLDIFTYIHVHTI